MLKLKTLKKQFEERKEFAQIFNNLSKNDFEWEDYEQLKQSLNNLYTNTLLELYDEENPTLIKPYVDYFSLKYISIFRTYNSLYAKDFDVSTYNGKKDCMYGVIIVLGKLLQELLEYYVAHCMDNSEQDGIVNIISEPIYYELIDLFKETYVTAKVNKSKISICPCFIEDEALIYEKYFTDICDFNEYSTDLVQCIL